MGAEVQCGNYLPGYYYMMDLNDDARSMVRSHFYEDRVMIRGQFYNGFVQQNSNDYSECDKELLKQTMLHHEAVFRKQVTELHRLYQVQKDLMDGMKRKETSKYPLPAESMHESQCLFQIRPDNSLRTWQMPMPSVVNSSCSRQSGSDTDNMQSSLALLMENGSMRKYYEPPDLERNRFSKRTFDLQLPADEYLDIEDTEPSTEEVKVLQASSRSLFGDNYGFNKYSDILAESEVKLTLGTGCNTSVSSDHCKQQTDHPRSVHGYKISESESSINHQGSSSQMAATSFRVPGLFVDEIRTRRLSFQPNASSSGPQKDHIKECNSGSSHRQFWNHLDFECEGSRVVWCSSSLGSGEYRSIGAPSPLGYRNVEGQFKKPCGLPASHLPDEQKQKDLWFKDHGDGYMGLSKMNLPDLNQTNAVTATSLPSAFSAPSQLDMANTAYAEIPWRTSMNTMAQLPFEVQSLEVPQGKNYPNKAPFPPFQGTELSEEKWYSNGSLRSSLRVDCEVPYHNGFALSELAANGSYPSSSLCFDKLGLNNGDCSSYGHSKEGGSKKLLKALDHHDIQGNKSVSLTSALPNGVGDGGECQSHKDLPFNKERKHSNHLEDQCKHVTVAKADFKSAYPNNGQGLSRLQFISGIDLEVQLEVESEMPTLCEKRPVDAGSVTRSKGGPGIVHDFVLFPANKHKSAFIPEAGQAHNSSCSKLKFLKEPFSIDFSSVSTSTKGCQRFGGSKNHALLREFQGSTRCTTSQGFGKQISVDRTHESHTHKDIHDNSTGLCHNQSVFPERSLHESVHSSKMKHKRITKGVVPSEGRACTGNDKIVKPIDEERSGGREFDLNLDDSHQIVLGLPCDSVVTQTPLLPATLSERFSCTKESIKADRLTVNEICFSTGDNSFNSSIAIDRLAAELLIRISSLGSESSCAVASNRPELPLGDSLKWFADVVCSDAGQPDSTIIVEDCPEPFEEEDFFESMTLMLEDTKMDEDYCYKPKPQQEEKMAAEIDASPSQKQSTRRTPRRGRRQKDFQRDILPSLVSLSRNEVNEDMQTMGTLMRASGCFWQTGSARRNGCRNDRNSLKRGRRSRYSATAVEADDAVLAILQATCDPEVDKAVELQAFSWGKITRRRRKRRCPGTIPASCTTEKS